MLKISVLPKLTKRGTAPVFGCLDENFRRRFSDNFLTAQNLAGGGVSCIILPLRVDGVVTSLHVGLKCCSFY